MLCFQTWLRCCCWLLGIHLISLPEISTAVTAPQLQVQGWTRSRLIWQQQQPPQALQDPMPGCCRSPARRARAAAAQQPPSIGHRGCADMAS